MLDIVRVLTVEIGPRPSASAAERKAAQYVAGRLERAGFEVKVEPFRALTTFSLPYGLIYVGFIGACLLYLVSPWACFVLALLSLAVFRAEIRARPIFSHILPKKPSQNVVGVRPARQEATRRVILTAHLDSSRAALLFHPKLVPGFRLSFLITLDAMVGILILALIGLFRPLGWLWYLQLICALYLGVGLLLLIHRELFMAHTPGANDDASGVAVLVVAAEELSDLQTTELWAVATGCEESGLYGMLAFLEAHSFDRESTYFINLDNLGVGQVAYITAEGMLLVHPSDPTLVRLAEETANETANETTNEGNEEGLDVGGRPFHTLTTDAVGPLVHGYKAMSIMAFDRQGVLPHWHWPTDTIDNLEPTALETARRLLLGVVRRLDQGGL